MKILAIRGANLAALAGEFEADFTRAPLLDAGVFAISGPTGAGKSTLLDAMCLALYHSTPRLHAAQDRSIAMPDPGQPDGLSPQDPRALLRRGCAEGHAEVDFIGIDGRPWRARWQVRRARGKPTGKMQAAQASLIELPGRRVISTQISETRKQIEARLGLSFAQFQRSVLLAQNDFAALLKASAKDRAELLEAMTDTAIYADLSRRAHERCTSEERAIQALQDQLQGHIPLAPDERAALDAEAARAHAACARLQEREQALRSHLIWHEQITRASARLAQARQHAENLAQDIAARQADWAELAQMQALHPLVEIHRRQQQIRQEITRQQAQQNQQQAALPALRQQAAEAHARQQQTAQAFEQARTRREAAQPAIEQARQLDQQLAVQRASQRGLEQQAQQAQTQLQQLSDRHQRLQADCQRTAAALPPEQRPANWADPAALAALAALDTAALQDQLAQAQAQQSQLDEAERDIAHHAEQTRRLAELTQRQSQTHAAHQAALAEQQQTDAALPACEQAERDSRQALERASLAADAVTQRLREALAPGQPCLVCGSPDHPGLPAHQHASSALLEHMRQTAAQAEADLRQQRQRQQQAAAHSARALAQWQAAQAACDEARAHLHSASQRLARHRSLPAAAGPQAMQSWLDQARQQCKEQQRAAQARLHLAQLCQQSEQARHSRDEQQAQLTQLHADCQRARQQAEATARARQAALPQPDASAHAAALDHAQRQALQTRDAAAAHANEQARLLREAEHQIDTTAQALAAAQTQAETTAEQLRQALRHLPFALNEDELPARLQAWQHAWPELPRRQRQRDELLARQRDAQAVIEDQSQTLRELQTTPPAPIPEENPQEIQPTNPPETPEQAQAALQAAQAALNQALSERAALQQQQKQDEQCRQTHARQQAQIQARRQAAQRWRALNQLIGSASGDAFRRYAQQYTLDVLLAYANQHLARLAARYRLQRGLDPLSLCIADGEFADELRSAHSLSGGESFLVSLALALGLASLSSEKVKVESLFIDEGFSSLDADTLQTVMQALDRLQAGGRRIGVISHVHDMAERIGVQIRIQPQGGGQSALTVQG